MKLFPYLKNIFRPKKQNENEADNEVRLVFWFYNEKLDAILIMLSAIVDYDLWDDEREAIKYGLKGTNSEDDLRFDYIIEGKVQTLKLTFAYDSDVETGIVHLTIECDKSLKNSIEMLNLFQSLFKKLEE